MGIVDEHTDLGRSNLRPDKVTVLVADATAAGAILVEDLARAGYDVHHARDIESARELVETLRPDVALIELWLGSQSGLELLTEITLLSSETKALIVTMYGSIESAQRAISQGACNYLTKPVTVHELEVTLWGMPPSSAGDANPWEDVQEVRRRYIQEVLAQCRSLAKTARALCVDRKSLRRMMRRLALRD
jgi:ActR/RegA family two-component response regulator